MFVAFIPLIMWIVAVAVGVTAVVLCLKNFNRKK